MDEAPGYRRWVAPQSRAVLLLVHGLGANVARWEATADFFLKNSISSYAVECTRAEEYSDHILRLRDVISRNEPGKKIFLTGESLGALYSFLVACRERGLFSELICFSPAFRSKLKLSLLDYLKVFLSFFYNKNSIFKLPFNSSMCTRDDNYIKKLDSDKLESRGIASSSMVDTLFAQVRARYCVNKIDVSVLFMVAGDDKIVDSKATVDIFKSLKAQDKTLIEYPDMYHSLSVELGKEKVFEDMLSWIECRL